MVLRAAFILIGAVFGLSAAGPVSAASLEEELAGLLLDHPNIRAADKTVEALRQEVKRAKSDFYPRISTTADVGMERIDSPAERNQGDGQEGEISSRTPQSGNITFTQNLFNGFLTSSLVRTAKLNRELARMTLEETRQNTVFEGIIAYVNVLRQKRLIELAKENETTIKLQLNLEDERVQRGSGIAVDVLQAKSRLQDARIQLVTFQGGLEDAISRFTQTFNHNPDINSMMDPVPPVEMVPSDLERVLDLAIVGNPALGNTGMNIEIARESRQAAKSEFYPVLDLESQWNFEKHAGAVIGVRRDYSVILRATWDLFTGFSTRNLLSQAAFNLGASKDTHEFTSRKVIEQARLAWQALLTARKRLELQENAVNIASEVFVSRQKLREAGKETLINVLDAENEVNRAQINFTSSSYDERLAVYQLLLAMGLLSPVGLNLY